MPNLIDSSKANRLTGVILLVFSLFLFSLPDVVIKFLVASILCFKLYLYEV